MRIAIVALTLTALAACTGDDSEPTQLGSVTGHVLAGPTCPVEQPGDPQCQPVAVIGVIEFRRDNRVVASTRLDAGGAFAAELPAGAYTITVEPDSSPFPLCEATSVEVVAGTDSPVEIHCDTGIR